ncbi:hypothetical protein CsSME_00022402 [Camellia sinensis var. sinensis]
MAMGSERSKPLHNFTMPCLKWGSQRYLRCMKMNPNGEVCSADRRSSASEVDKRLIGRRIGRTDRKESFQKSPSPAETEVGVFGRKSKAASDGDDGIEAVREKLMFDLQTAADKMKVAILREGLEDVRPPTAAAAPAEADGARPWNLRTRRAACKAPTGINGAIGGGGGLVGDVTVPAGENLAGEMRDRAKFSVSLCRREIGDDFMVIAGHRPPRRPKKRPKIVQEQLDCLFPGLWLTEITADIYKVPEVPETGKWYTAPSLSIGNSMEVLNSWWGKMNP